MRGTFSILLFILSIHSVFALSPLKEAEDRRQVNALAIQEAIHSPRAVDRAHVAKVLGRIQKADGVDVLLNLLNDNETKVRKEAIFALGQLGWEKNFSNGRESEIAHSLKMFLHGDDLQLKRLAIEATGKLGLDETPLLLIDLLEDSDASVKAETLVALYRYRLVQKLRNSSSNPALLSNEQMNSLVNLKENTAKQVREKLAYYFWRVKDDRGIDILLELSKSKDLWTRYFAISALGKYKNDKIAEILLTATKDRSYHIRSAAINSITSLGLTKSLNPTLMNDPSYHVKIAYIQSIGTLSPTVESKEILRKMYYDTNLSVKAEALKALAQFPDSYDFVLSALENKSWVIRAAATSALASFTREEQKSILEKARNDEDTRVRVSALEAATSIEADYAFNAIKDALQSIELSERGTAVSALSSRKEEARMRLAFDCYKSSQDEKWVEAREEMVKLWSTLVSEETNEYLKAATNDPKYSIASLALKTLEERGISDISIQATTEELSFSPYRDLTFKRNPRIIFTTTKGKITMELFHNEAPIHVANIVGFAEENKYNGLPFHRVVSNFVIQGGDPDKSGWGSAGYSLRAEINPRKFLRGSLGMPRSTGFDTGGIQFFINHIPTPHLNGQYTVFGQVIDGMNVVDQIEVGDLIISSRVYR